MCVVFFLELCDSLSKSFLGEMMVVFMMRVHQH